MKERQQSSRETETETATETQELYKRPRLGLWCLPRRVRLVVVSVKETKTLHSDSAVGFQASESGGTT